MPLSLSADADDLPMPLRRFADSYAFLLRRFTPLMPLMLPLDAAIIGF